jgi:hypothetical protein
MTRFILILAFLFSPLHAAISEKYVSSLAGGGGDGSSGSPYTFTEMVTQINGGSAAGTRYNVKADGTYTRGATDTITGSGSSTSPIIIRGYTTTITDGYQGRSNEFGALATTNMPSIVYSSTYRWSSTGDWIIFESLNISGDAANTLIVADADSMIVRCKIENSNTNSAADVISTGNRSVAFDSDITLTSASGGDSAIDASGAASKIIGCRVRVSTSTAANTIKTAASTNIINNIIIGGNHGLAITSTTAAPVVMGNTFVGAAADAINVVTGSTVLNTFWNNLITDNAGDGIDMVVTTNAVAHFFNRFRDNANSLANAGDWSTANGFGNDDDGTTGDTSTDYENYGSGDYRIKSTSPATNAGFPENSSIGAYQRNQSGVGGSSPSAHTFVQ